MRNTTLYYGAIALGVIVLIVGLLYMTNIMLGYHPSRQPTASSV